MGKSILLNSKELKLQCLFYLEKENLKRLEKTDLRLEILTEYSRRDGFPPPYFINPKFHFNLNHYMIKDL